MSNRNGIFIFTKNREVLLKRAAQSLIASAHPIYIIDDSTTLSTRHEVAKFCCEKGFYYHGIKEQAKLMEVVSEKCVEIKFLLKVLGDGQWNLGFARNHALFLAVSSGVEKALFLDDDIEVENSNLPASIFEALEEYELIGGKIVGMPDDSIIGHIAAKTGIEHNRLYSGGCLAFRTSTVDQYFLNVYNEDWIWQYMQLSYFRHALVGEVRHEFFDPFNEWKRKLRFQEIGEVMIDGLEIAIDENRLSTITEVPYWEEQLKERERYLINLKDLCESKSENTAVCIIDNLLGSYPVITSCEISQTFIDYFRRRELFRQAYLTFQ